MCTHIGDTMNRYADTWCAVKIKVSSQSGSWLGAQPRNN